MNPPRSTCDLAVVGTGVAGLAAALFAAARGLAVTRVGVASEIIFASGLLDLMGVHPVAAGKVWRSPWKAVEAVARDIPRHPYARLTTAEIRAALDEFLDALREGGLPYRRDPRRNVEVVTPLGTLKTTYAVPASMWHGVAALQNQRRCLFVGIRGLRGYSVRRITETLKDRWAGLRHAEVAFPGLDRPGAVYAERLAQSLMLPDVREQLAEAVRPHLGGAEAAAFPAVFGLRRVTEVLADMEGRLGVPIFELPTVPPAIPGMRIKETMDGRLEAMGVRPLVGRRVLRARGEGRGFALEIGNGAVEEVVRCRGVILATGRFIGKGLTADRSRIREALFDLHVHQPGARKEWHRRHFLDPRGHLINRAGLEIDDRFRPLDRRGRPAFDNLHAAGSILAHQDWTRMKCGSGLAIATAYGAVRAFLANKKRP